MAASDDFKEKLKAGKIVDALTLALTQAIELEVTTWVSSEEANQPQPGHYLRTRMNIVDGKIENEVGSEFIGNGSYTDLQKFHLEQLKEGQQITQRNLESLQKLFVVLTSTLSQLPQSSRRLSEEKPSALSPAQDTSQ